MIIYDKSGKYSGFLGNIMFQTAATIGIAIKNGHQYGFPYKDDLSFFKGKIPILEMGVPTIDIPENQFHFEDIVVNPAMLGNNYNLLGYRQSHKYFQHCESLIRELFKFNDNIKEYVENKYLKIIGSSECVSIHVRRGDYLNHPDSHPTLDIAYYNKAISLIGDVTGDSRKYIVFSNDFAWCKENFSNHPQINNFIFAEGNEPKHDMFFMTQCNHHIIANSTMSWWGSWLCEYENKVVVAPTKDKWFGKTYAHWNLDDLYLPNWLLI